MKTPPPLKFTPAELVEYIKTDSKAFVKVYELKQRKSKEQKHFNRKTSESDPFLCYTSTVIKRECIFIPKEFEGKLREKISRFSAENENSLPAILSQFDCNTLVLKLNGTELENMRIKEEIKSISQ